MSATASASRIMTSTRPRTQGGGTPTTVRRAIESATGRVLDVEQVATELNCAIAALLRTPTQTVFIKGLPSDHPRVATQRREAQINPHIVLFAPHLLWQLERGGWNILGFEYLNGRHANFTPGSPALPKLADALRRLGQITAPDLPLRRLDDR